MWIAMGTSKMVFSPSKPPEVYGDLATLGDVSQNYWRAFDFLLHANQIWGLETPMLVDKISLTA